MLNGDRNDSATAILSIINHLVSDDGSVHDIGAGGRIVNIIVLDTGVCSNIGG